jgi:tetratricopeptide (TPR) repeat protein
MIKYNLAHLNWSRGHIGEARQHLLEILDSNVPGPYRAYSLLLLGHIDYQEGELDASFDDCASVLSLAIENIPLHEKNRLLAGAYSGMSYAEWARGNLEAACQFAKEAIECDPSHAAAYAYLAGCYADMGESRRAILAGRRAVQLVPERDIWWIVLGDIYREAEEPEEALICYKRARELGNCEAEERMRALFESSSSHSE